MAVPVFYRGRLISNDGCTTWRARSVPSCGLAWERKTWYDILDVGAIGACPCECAHYAVGVLAARTTLRKALWIAAGLGDVRGYLDRKHKPTAAAHRMRPDSVAVGMPGAMPPMPCADHEEVLREVLLVAVLNGRANVFDDLVAYGAPVNSLLYGIPLIQIAVGNEAEHEHELPMHEDADAVLEIAISLATERRSETVDGLHLLLALTARHRCPVADLLTRYGECISDWSRTRKSL